MINNSKSDFSEKERLAIYRKARDIYAADHDNDNMYRVWVHITGNRACLGMCRALRQALIRTINGAYANITPDNFPEYFSYKPKTGWKQDDQYWWTISIKNGGFKKRMTVLNRLADGLSKGE